MVVERHLHNSSTTCERGDTRRPGSTEHLVGNHSIVNAQLRELKTVSRHLVVIGHPLAIVITTGNNILLVLCDLMAVAFMDSLYLSA